MSKRTQVNPPLLSLSWTPKSLAFSGVFITLLTAVLIWGRLSPALSAGAALLLGTARLIRITPPEKVEKRLGQSVPVPGGGR